MSEVEIEERLKALSEKYRLAEERLQKLIKTESLTEVEAIEIFDLHDQLDEIKKEINELSKLKENPGKQESEETDFDR